MAIEPAIASSALFFCSGVERDRCRRIAFTVSSRAVSAFSPAASRSA